MNCGNCKKIIVETAFAVTIVVGGVKINLCDEICHKKLEGNIHPMEKNYIAEVSRDTEKYVVMGSPGSTLGISATSTDVTFNDDFKNI